MANELYTRTNQKLYFAGLALDAMGKAQHAGELNAQGMAQAEREAAIFHLYGALLGLCHEIGGFYRLPNATATRVEPWLDPALLEAYPIPELGELVEMAHQHETWLAQLLNCHDTLFKPPQPMRAPKGDVTQPLIVVVPAQPQEASLPSREELEGWRRQLKELVIRFRDGLSEC